MKFFHSKDTDRLMEPSFFKQHKFFILFQIDDVFYNISSIADDYLRAQVVRFFKGNDVPIMQNGQPQIFRNEKPTTTTTTTTPATTTTTTTQPLGNCSGDDLGIPDELSILNATSIVQVVNGTTDNTTIYIGGIITIGCENDDMVNIQFLKNNAIWILPDSILDSRFNSIQL